MTETLRPSFPQAVEFNPRTNEEKIRNQEIAGALNCFLMIERKHVDTKHFKSIIYNDPKNSLYEIAISAGDNTQEGFHGMIPEDFVLPAYTFSEGNYDQTANNNDWEHDIKPTQIVGPNNLIYFLKNIYFFNSKGQAFKYEFVHPSLSNPQNKDIFPKIDFIPSDKDAQYSHLNMVDYAIIRNGLIKIKDYKVKAI
jgi:hypothetical protein